MANKTTQDLIVALNRTGVVGAVQAGYFDNLYKDSGGTSASTTEVWQEMS